MNRIELEQTCEACPEQYWAYKGKHRIGYIRLRWGHLTCDYLPEGKLTDHDIRLIDHVFKGDEYKGCFDTEEERELYLNKCKESLMNKYNELRH